MMRSDRRAIKVLYFEDGLGFGGSLISLSELVDGLLAQRRVDPKILTSVDAKVDTDALFGGYQVRFRRMLNYKTRARMSALLSRSRILRACHPVVFRAYLVLHVLSELIDCIRLYLLIRREHIEVVHCNNGWIRPVVTAAAWARRPCVMHFRGFGVKDVHEPLLRAIRRQPIHTISISQAVATELREAGIPDTLSSVIYNPINVHKYAQCRQLRSIIRERHSLVDDHVVISIFGRITKWKGHLEFLKAADLLAQESENIRVVIVGDNSDAPDPEYLEVLKHFVTNSNLRNRVTFTGYQPDPRGYYWASDIVVHSSIEPEPFGRVIAEAMACSRAVVAMREGGAAEIIRHGHDGILVQPRDTAALAESMRRLAGSATERDRLGRNALESVSLRFDHPRICAQVADVYGRMLT